MQKKLSIKSAFATVLCISIAVFLADKSLYSDTISAGIWNLPFGKPSSLWQALSYNYKMNEPAATEQSSVTAEIHWFQKHQDYITELTHNAQPYIYYVYQQLRKRHMPAELALLPMVESSYVPFESSNVGATGLWQMMPDTASGLGLKAWGANGRRNVIASTDAALKYLAYLHRTFGSWPLALAAYNAGQGTVENAIQKNLKRHLPTNFWSLHLPKQTEEYVPKLLALATIIENPQRYNMHLEPVANKAYFGAVKVDKKINLADVAKLSDSDTKTIQNLNPGIKSASAPISKHTKYLLVPVDKLPVLQANLKDAKVLTSAPVVKTAVPVVKTPAPVVKTAAPVDHKAEAKNAHVDAAVVAHKAEAKPEEHPSATKTKHADSTHSDHRAAKVKHTDSVHAKHKSHELAKKPVKAHHSAVAHKSAKKHSHTSAAHHEKTKSKHHKASAKKTHASHAKKAAVHKKHRHSNK